MLGTRHSPPESPSWACFRSADPHKVPIDPNGNLTTKTEGTDTWTYIWNAENELTKVEKNGVEQARFAYDPKGRRIEKVAGSVTTTYTYSGVSILREVRGSTILKYVEVGLDEPVSQEDGTAVSYLHADGLGSIAKVTSDVGAVTLTRQYDVWGNMHVGASESGVAFTGREWDSEIGLYYYRARYYDPNVGRFVSEDPSGLESGINLYLYVDANPINAIDPLGLCPRVCGIRTPPEYNFVRAIFGGQTFSWSATFEDSPPYDPACCEVRQLISWNDAAGNPPHPGFPKSYKPGR